jgi:AraC-like DNA-binding protein
VAESIIESDYTWVSPSPVARRLLWHVLGTGRSTFFARSWRKTYMRPGAVLFWVESGSGTLEMGSDRFKLEPGSNFWLFGLSKPRVFVPDPGGALVIRTIRFSGPGLNLWLDELRTAENPDFHLRPQWTAEIHAMRRKLVRLFKKPTTFWEWEVHQAMTSVLQKFVITRKLLPATPQELPEPIVRALEAIRSNPSRDWTVRELAAHVGMSYSSFRDLFRESMHETVHDHLQRIRLDQARVLLSNPRLRIKEIAKRLDFASEHYFSHFFHTRIGVTPTEFRAHLGVGEAAK